MTKTNILYVFGGEKAQGAEIVIERLMNSNSAQVNTHLILSPGKFADELLLGEKPYCISVFNKLKKLNRSSSGKSRYYFTALTNYIGVSYRVNRYIIKNKIQIVHANTIVPASYLLPLIIYSRLFSNSVKWYWSDHDLKYFSKIDSFLSRLCVRLYDRTLVVSEAVKRKYSSHENKIYVLYNGLDTDQFNSDPELRRAFREKWSLSANSLVFGIAASINPDKGHLGLVKAFDRLSLVYPNVKLLLAGDFASHFPEYKLQIEDAMENNDNIVYVGFLNNIASFYNGCDVIINNSNDYRSESLGTTIYEAMACEKLVVGSNTGGTPEIITDKENGFLFMVDNADDLYEKLLYITTNYSTLDNVKHAARKTAERKFNIAVMLRNYRSLLIDSIANN